MSWNDLEWSEDRRFPKPTITTPPPAKPIKFARESFERIQKRADKSLKDRSDLFSGWLACMVFLSLFLCAPVFALSKSNAGVLLPMFIIALAISTGLVIWGKSVRNGWHECSLYCYSYKNWLFEQRSQYVASLKEPMAAEFRLTSQFYEWQEEARKRGENSQARISMRDPMTLEALENNRIIASYGGIKASYDSLPWSVKNSPQGKEVKDGTWGQPPDPYYS